MESAIEESVAQNIEDKDVGVSKEEISPTVANGDTDHEKSANDDETETKENGKVEDFKEKDELPKEKSPLKNKKSSPQESASEEQESGDEDHPKRLFEQPLVIEDGRKRQRKQVERLSTEIDKNFAKESERKKILIPEGSGMPLGEIEFVDNQIKKTQPADLKLLHYAAFGRDTIVAEIRSNLKQFKGFDFPENTHEYERRAAYLKTKRVVNLKVLLRLLGLETSGTRDELVSRVLAFLLKPHDTGKIARKSAGTRQSRKSDGRKSKSAVKSTEDSDEDSSHPEDDDSEKSNEESSDYSDASEKKRKKSKPKKSPVKASPKPKGTPARKKRTSQSPKSAPEPKKAKTESADESDLPSDSEIKNKVKELLKDANLNEITMKTVIEQVSQAYPKKDLSSKRSFIKETVKEALNN